MNLSDITETEWKLRVDLAAAFHLAVANNLHEAIANHFSAVLPDGQHFRVNPFGLHFSEITASNSATSNAISPLKSGCWMLQVDYIGADGD